MDDRIFDRVGDEKFIPYQKGIRGTELRIYVFGNRVSSTMESILP